MNNNQLSSLPKGAFAGLSSLQVLFVANLMSCFILECVKMCEGMSWPNDVCAKIHLSSFRGAGNNQLTGLPDDAFAGLTSLQTLFACHGHASHQAFRSYYYNRGLYSNRLTILPPCVFAGLASLDQVLDSLKTECFSCVCMKLRAGTCRPIS